MGSSGSTCPDDNKLGAVADLDEAERAAIIDHAASCDSCRPFVFDALAIARGGGLAEAETEISGEQARGDVELPPTIDRYRVDRRIGAGAMGVVFAGYDPELARPVAIKVLRSGASSDRMKREAQALAQLAHPNVVAVYDVGEENGSTFVAMALVDGENLRTWLGTPRDTAAILDAIVQAARGLEVAHAAGIVHRDIKPDNVFVAKTGEVLVGDFGLARMTDEAASVVDDSLLSSSELTGTGAVVGTPAYMAPEQASGEATAATDQFALCVTAWEALYGSRPFTGRTLGEIVAAIRNGPPPTPKTRDVPAHVRAAIRRGLAADPKARHASMSAFLAALQPRRRWPFVVAGALVLATASGITALAMRTDPEEACSLVEKPAGWTIPANLKPAAVVAFARTLDRYANDWHSLATSTCLASARGELARPAYATTMRCLDERLDTLHWITKQPANAGALAEALEPIETCRDLEPVAAPSAELATLQRDLARAFVAANYQARTATGLDELLMRANQLGDQAAIATASYLVGRSRYARSEDPSEVLQVAIATAERANDARIRARASALLSRLKTRKDLLSEATVLRDAAISASARASDPVTSIAVEEAKAELAFRRRDASAEIAAYRRIEGIEIERFGEVSGAVVYARMMLSRVLQRLGKLADAKHTMDLAMAAMEQLVDGGPLSEAALQMAYASETDRSAKVLLQEQIVAALRRRGADARELAMEIAALGWDYEAVGDHARAFESIKEAVSIASPPTNEDIEGGTRIAIKIADETDDAATRTNYVGEGLALLDRLPADVQGGDNVQSHRGELLLLGGRPRDAIPYLENALAVAEAKEPQIPGHIMNRSFLLAQALWETGGTRDRDRAIALAEQAERRVPDVRKDLEERGLLTLLPRLERMRLRIEAWRRTHKVR
ncbi:MAG: protein kinase domain-containing protein [Kofleriaceae bacterium]